MYNFFVDASAREENIFRITGSDYNHIKNVLRMKAGDTILVSTDGVSHLCCLERLDGDEAIASIREENYQNTELPIRIVLYQGLPKADKMELILQKAVELGASEIVPVEMSRCVMKLEEKKREAKISRWQAIVESAAKQSKRSLVPVVGNVLTYREMLERARNSDLFLVPYENAEGMKATRDALKRIQPGMTVSLLIGPEGGFSEKEIEEACLAGAQTVSLGQRILRTETAALMAVGMCMLQMEMYGLGGNE